MSDAKYFTSSKKGEIYELKQALNSVKKNEKRDAVKKVIASMTVGKDVSSLFSDVINCIQTDNLELKKLVYLYLMNYAKTQPDLAIMAVNTFVKDCVDPNPLVRALAVRTMGCIRVDKITEYLCDPLRKCLKNDDPYVRKTAAVCVAKLYDIDPALVEEQGFIDALQDLLCDPNPMVVANAVVALSEINEYSTSGQLFDINSSSVTKLLTALNECTEWGQVFILDSLAVYEPRDQRELQSICERVAPRLQHVNAAVVLSAVKVLMKNLEHIQDQDYKATLFKKLAPPLVTLLSSEPEVQYVALRNINLIVQKYPNILSQHMKVFFVKYNDPIYVKLEKLDVMIRLASEANIQEVLAELKEYATEVDVDFVRKSVRAIGRCAIKVDGSAQRCVDTLLELIQTKVNYVVQEAIIVIKDIFRKYPNKYESIIATLCENLDSLDESEAKAAMIWIVGEYAERIDNADELLESFLVNFTEEPSQVQLQLLTAIVKLFVKRPSGTQDLVQKVLGLATQESDNPDLRDRGYIYWRLLLTDPAAAKAVVLCEKPLISEETDLLEPSLLDELLCHISSLASVYHKPPSTFVEGRVPGRRIMPKALLGDDEEPVDLLGLGDDEGAAAEQSGAAHAADLLGGLDMGGPVKSMSYVPPKETWADAAKGQGVELSGTFARRSGQMYMDLTFANRSAFPVSDFAIQFNKNSFGLNPAAALDVPQLSPGQTADVSLQLNTLGAVQRMEPLAKLQVAIKFNNTQKPDNVFYFSCMLPFHMFFIEDGKIEKAEYLSTWQEINDTNEVISTHHNQVGGSEQIATHLAANNIFAVAKRTQDGQEMIYLSMKFSNGVLVLAELTISGINAVQLALKSQTTEVYNGVQQVFEGILSHGSSDA